MKKCHEVCDLVLENCALYMYFFLGICFTIFKTHFIRRLGRPFTRCRFSFFFFFFLVYVYLSILYAFILHFLSFLFRLHCANLLFTPASTGHVARFYSAVKPVDQEAWLSITFIQLA